MTICALFLAASKNGPEGAAEVAEALKVFNGSLNELNLRGKYPHFHGNYLNFG